MIPRQFVSSRWLVLLVLLLPTVLVVHGQSESNDSTYHICDSVAGGEEEMEPIVNPLIEQRADPWIYRHTDGFYYFTASVPEYDRIEVRRAETIQGLASAEPAVVWRKHDRGIMSKHIWAPEIHYIDEKWYIYFAAAREDAFFDHRMYVLETDAPNPLEGTWVERGQIVTSWETFSLDATSFEHDDVRYLVWAQREPGIRGNSNLYIASMRNPWTLESEPVRLTIPEYEWEIQGFLVNEGAAAIVRNGRVFITYSASATNANYAMGMLTSPADSNLLDANSWTKSPEPVFVTNRQTGQYGPGHNSFTVSPDGEDLLVYHARNYEDIVGDPLYDPNRHTRVQVLHWNEDGTPQFGVPVPDGPLPMRFTLYADDARFLAHIDGRLSLTSDMNLLTNSQFRVVPGLANADAVSLEAIIMPGQYLRHRDGEIWLEEADDTAAFADSATWYARPGFAGDDGVSFESYNMADHYVTYDGDLLYLRSLEDGSDNMTFRQDC